MHIAIAGAGLAGRLLALILSRRGHQVSVFDIAGNATDKKAAGWTAAGMLSPLAELETGNDYVYDLGRRSLQLWPQIVEQLDTPVDLSSAGSLMLAHRGDEGAAQRLISLLQKKAPADDQPIRLDSQRLAELEPSVQQIPNSWLLQNEGHIDTPQAMSAMAQSAHDVHWHWGQNVFQCKPGTIKLLDHTELNFDMVFDTRGTGARTMRYPNMRTVSCCNVRGVRGEVLWLYCPEVNLQRPIRLLHPRYRVYIVPRSEHRLLVGASEIESEDRSPISVRTTVELLTAAHSVLPALAEARIIHTETNLRPALADNFPRIEAEDGLCRINGLFRHGWLIAPALIEEALQKCDLLSSSQQLFDS